MAFADPLVGRVVINAGKGPYKGMVTLAEACEIGDVLGISTATWVKAFGDVSGVFQGRMVALKKGEIGEVIPVSDTPTIGGYTDATPGGYVYVSEVTPGAITQTLPDTTNDATTKIGMALSATTVMFFLNRRVDALSA
jgi:hypothetical protein